MAPQEAPSPPAEKEAEAPGEPVPTLQEVREAPPAPKAASRGIRRGSIPRRSLKTVLEKGSPRDTKMEKAKAWWGALPRKTKAIYLSAAAAGLILFSIIYLILFGGSRWPEEDFENAGEMVVRVLDKRWNLEGMAVKEAEETWKALKSDPGASGQETEEDLRKILRKKRSNELQVIADQFRTYLDESCQTLIKDAGLQHGIKWVDLISDWHAWRGYRILDNLKILWNHKERSSKFAKSYFPEGAGPPDGSAGSSVEGFKGGELRGTIFGAKVSASLSRRGGIAKVSMALRSNYHRLVRLGEPGLDLTDVFQMPVTQQGNLYFMNLQSEIQEYLKDGLSSDWCSRAFKSAPGGAESSPAPEK